MTHDTQLTAAKFALLIKTADDLPARMKTRGDDKGDKYFRGVTVSPET